jgi:hypothetical protein
MMALNLCLFRDRVYIGAKLCKIYQAETGYTDNGAAINYDGWQANTFLRTRGQVKLFNGIKVNFRASSNNQVQLILNTDFNSRSRSVTYRIGVIGGTEWDMSEWDSFEWGGGEVTRGKWKIVNGKGYCASLRIVGAVSGNPMAWQDTSYMYNPAGML